MREKVLAVWMDGWAVPAGHLARTANGETGFLYSKTYEAAGGVPLSLALPLAQGEFGDIQARAFFANLLPENAQLQKVMEREGLARDDVVGLLAHLGADCAGAVSCLPLDAAPIKTPGVLEEDYERLSDKAVLAIVKGLHHTRRLPAAVRDPSPVAGVQCKIALTVLPDGGFALPRAGLRVPTTHILKVPGQGHSRDARHEEASALLAQSCGLDVSVPTAIKVGDYDALLIERFDRRVADGVVTRIHQEDFAQALGLPSTLKYQRHGQPGRWFDVAAALSVLDRARDPVSARLSFLEATLFNLCIGNTDNHAKNHALLYDDGAVPRFAPLYDLLPIRIDHRYTHELAFRIGEARYFDEATREDFVGLFEGFGVRPEAMQTFMEEIVARLVEALESATPILRGLGMKAFDDLVGRETEHLVETLALKTPVRARDYFPMERTGAWGQTS